MNAIFPLGTPVTAVRPLLNFSARLREHPIPGQDSIRVTIDGAMFRVFHTAGRLTSVHIQMPDDIILPGVVAQDAVPGSLHGQAAQLADGLLAGLRRAGEWPMQAPPAQPVAGWRFALFCAGFAALGFVPIWVAVVLAFAMGRLP